MLERRRALADAAHALAAAAPDWIPERIDGYRILAKLGEGGMGIVFEAEQDTPRRRVALKLVHPMFTSAQSLRR